MIINHYLWYEVVHLIEGITCLVIKDKSIRLEFLKVFARFFATKILSVNLFFILFLYKHIKNFNVTGYLLSKPVALSLR